MAGTYGGFSPQPEQYGGGKARVEFIYDGLNATRGVLYDTSDDGSAVAVENRAFARELDNEWAVNDRAQLQFQPLTTTDMLPRWERIFGIAPYYQQSDYQRRAALAFQWSALGKYPTYQQVFDDLTFLAPGVFVSLGNSNSVVGPIYYPGSSFSNPYTQDGNTVAGVSPVDWWSNILHIRVQVTQPSGMPSWLYQQYVSAMLVYLDATLPAWCTFAAFTYDVHGSAGFFLDEANLGLEAFNT